MVRDRLFLDANVLFSAAYREESGVRRLWDLSGVVLCSSAYAVEEAHRNLTDGVQRERLAALVEPLEFTEVVMLPPGLPLEGLPEKDRPILAGAVAVRATHLITGDVRHFGTYCGGRNLVIRIRPPARYLRERGA